jgi:hypothetical protein
LDRVELHGKILQGEFVDLNPLPLMDVKSGQIRGYG